MKKTLLFKKQNSKAFYSLLLCCLCFTLGWGQTNLVLNGSADEHTSSTTDNADAWDMTPNDKILDEGGLEIDSPYNALWNNTDLEAYLETTYNGGVNLDEAAGSTSDGTYNGAVKTRGLKLYGDGDPVVSASTRRLYHKVAVTSGVTYTFSLDSRSEAENIPTEIFILNEEITTEVGLENGAADTRVDAFMEITNDYNPSKGGEGDNTFTNSSLTFTASGSFVVIYARALLANSGATEVFIDNLSLVESATASLGDVFASKFSLYPNPASESVKIKAADVAITSLQVYNMLGKQVYMSASLTSSIDVSDFSKGMYLLKLNTEEGSSTKKLIVE